MSPDVYAFSPELYQAFCTEIQLFWGCVCAFLALLPIAIVTK